MGVRQTPVKVTGFPFVFEDEQRRTAPSGGCPFFESRGGNGDSPCPLKGLPKQITVRQGGGELIAEGVVVIALGHRAGGVGELNHVAVGIVLVVALGAARDAPRQGQTPDVLLYRGAGDLQCQLCD